MSSWGRGQGGRLGLNSEEDQCSPREVQLKTEDIYITNVECGVDGTIFISHEGELYACGDNKHNRLGLNDQNGWIFSGVATNCYIHFNVTLRRSEASSGPDKAEVHQAEDHLGVRGA